MGMMKYVESLLGKNEQILWRARQHWIVLSANFVINLFIFIVIWAIYGAAGMLGAGLLGDFLRNNRGIALIALLIPIGWFGWEFLQWWAEEYLITTTSCGADRGLDQQAYQGFGAGEDQRHHAESIGAGAHLELRRPGDHHGQRYGHEYVEAPGEAGGVQEDAAGAKSINCPMAKILLLRSAGCRGATMKKIP